MPTVYLSTGTFIFKHCSVSDCNHNNVLKIVIKSPGMQQFAAPLTQSSELYHRYAQADSKLFPSSV